MICVQGPEVWENKPCKGLWEEYFRWQEQRPWGRKELQGLGKVVEKNMLKTIVSQCLPHVLLPFTPLENRPSVGLW